MKKHALTLVALAFAGLALGSGGLAVADATSHEPHPNTIVEVAGDKANGFSIFRYDGTAEFPPTDSEARAECSEYDTPRRPGAMPHRGAGLVPRPRRPEALDQLPAGDAGLAQDEQSA